MNQIQLDGWDAILIAIAIAIVVSVLKDFYKTWRKKHSGQATGVLMYIMIGMNIFLALFNLRNATRKV